MITVLEINRITLLSNLAIWRIDGILVLEIYRITLLSNAGSASDGSGTVLEIYRITLLSNPMSYIFIHESVLEIYRITLLSNAGEVEAPVIGGFRDLQNYTTLKLWPRCRSCNTTLKLSLMKKAEKTRFRDLQNYTTLKLFYHALTV